MNIYHNYVFGVIFDEVGILNDLDILDVFSYLIEFFVAKSAHEVIKHNKYLNNFQNLKNKQVNTQ